MLVKTYQLKNWTGRKGLVDNTHGSLCPLNYHRFVQTLIRRIKGKEQCPAGSVLRSVTSSSSIIFLYTARGCIRTSAVVPGIRKSIYFLPYRNIVCSRSNGCLFPQQYSIVLHYYVVRSSSKVS